MKAHALSAVLSLLVADAIQAQTPRDGSPYGPYPSGYGSQVIRANDPVAEAQRILQEPDNRRYGELQQALSTLQILLDQKPALAETEGLMDAVALHLRSPHEYVARQSAHILCRNGLKWLPRAMEGLNSDRQNERIACITLISGLARNHPEHLAEFSPAINSLRNTMLKKRRVEQSLAISALYALGEPALATLAEGLSLPANQGGQEVAQMLSAHGVMALPALRAALAGNDLAARRNAAIALSRFKHGDAAPAVPELLAALKDPNDDTRRLALRALCLTGKEFRAAAPIILDHVEAGEPGYLHALHFSKIDVEHLDRVLNCLLITSEPVYDASVILSSAGPGAAPRLTAALSEFPPNQQVSVIIALGAIGPSAEVAVPELWKLAADGNSSAIGALAKITPEDEKLAKLVIENFKQGSWSSDIVGSHFDSDMIAPAHDLARHQLPLVLEGLRHDDRSVRKGCFLALTGLPADKFREMLPALQDLVNQSQDISTYEIVQLPRGSGMTPNEYLEYLEGLGRAERASFTDMMVLSSELKRAREMKVEDLTTFLQSATPFAYPGAYPMHLDRGAYGYIP